MTKAGEDEIVSNTRSCIHLGFPPGNRRGNNVSRVSGKNHVSSNRSIRDRFPHCSSQFLHFWQAKLATGNVEACTSMNGSESSRSDVERSIKGIRKPLSLVPSSVFGESSEA